VLMLAPLGGDSFTGPSGASYSAASGATAEIGGADVRQALIRNWAEVAYPNPPTVAQLPPASSVTVSTQRYTSDQGWVYSNGAAWLTLGSGGGGGLTPVASGTILGNSSGVSAVPTAQTALPAGVTTAAGGQIFGSTDTQTLTNKTVDGGSNTLTNLPAGQLVGSLNVSAISGQWPVTNGGTGAASLTGLVLGNGTSAMSNAAATDVASLFSGGSATSLYYLAADGTKQLNSAGAADPTLAYTWTNIHTWSLAEPRLLFNETDRGTDLKLWDLDLNAGVLSIRTRTDADGAGNNVLSATRGTTTALTNMTFGYSVSASYTFPFTGTATFSGAVSVDRLVLTGTSSVTNGFSVPTGNTPTAYSNSTARFQWTSSGITLLTGGNFVAGTAGMGIQIKEGTNAKMGVGTLVAGTVTVSNTAVTANSRIFLTAQSLGTVTAPSALCISARTAGTSFTILASQNTDTSVVAWQIVEPAP